MKKNQLHIKDKKILAVAAELSSLAIKVMYDVPLKKMSTFKIGGTCDLAVFPKNKEELITTINIASFYNIKYDVIGRGSNVLFGDNGYKGMLIFTSHMRHIDFKSDGLLIVGPGANITTVSMKAAMIGLADLEFACGIPGSCGGAVYMNAGAYGGEISDILEYSEYYDVVNRKIVRLENNEHNFSYRHSIYSDNKDMIITEVGFRLRKDKISDIEARMNENTIKRRMSQPHEYPNAGSIFKRPNGGFAAKMIDECGLKGLSCGDAQVSEKHAGFIVNKGNATASDVLLLIDKIKQAVYDHFGVELECEIRIIK